MWRVPDCCFLNDVQVFYFSGVVLTNYLAYGMLQINMIWWNAVMPRQYNSVAFTFVCNIINPDAA